LIDSHEQQIKDNESLRPTIAVHCVAGLGRAPVLVAIALIELGMEPLDAVAYIRTNRRGAFNKPQISYLVSSACDPMSSKSIDPISLIRIPTNVFGKQSRPPRLPL
jgi:hypothetical protein